MANIFDLVELTSPPASNLQLASSLSYPCWTANFNVPDIVGLNFNYNYYLSNEVDTKVDAGINIPTSDPLPRYVSLQLKSNIGLTSQGQYSFNPKDINDLQEKSNHYYFQVIDTNYYDNLLSQSAELLAPIGSAQDKIKYVQKIIDDQSTPLNYAFLESVLANLNAVTSSFDQEIVGAQFSRPADVQNPANVNIFNGRLLETVAQSQLDFQSQIYDIYKESQNYDLLKQQSNIPPSPALTLKPFANSNDGIAFALMAAVISAAKKPAHVGYEIEKYRVGADGLLVERSVTYVTANSGDTYVDSKAAYGSTYQYVVKNVVMYALKGPVIAGNQTADLYLLTSNPCIPKRIKCITRINPEPPRLLKPTFDRSKRRISLLWEHPVESTLSVKGYFVFRRRSIRDPYEMIGFYDFNDANPRYAPLDPAISELPETVKLQDNDIVMQQKILPASYLDSDLDTDFYMKRKPYYYALASYTAHGEPGVLSSQLKVSYDNFYDNIVVETVSPQGSLINYPNTGMNLEIFKDVNVVDGYDMLETHFDPSCFMYKQSGASKASLVANNLNNSSSPSNFYCVDMVELNDVIHTSFSIAINANDLVAFP